jgi:citrate synthase
MTRSKRSVNLDPLNVSGRMLESEEAARRLDVKVATLYAYVSRGLLHSYPSPDPNRSLFSFEQVEALARRAARGRSSALQLATITTGVTQLRPEGPLYMGRPVLDLVDEPFERVAGLLWGWDVDPWRALPLRPPRRLSTADTLRWVTVMVGSRDRSRSLLERDAITERAATLTATMATAVRTNRVAENSLPLGRLPSIARLLASLSPLRQRRLVSEAVNRALVLLADHELATSTLAVRIAASTHADLYDAVLAGLGTLGGPFHGAAGDRACRFLLRAEDRGVEETLDEALTLRNNLPGFGHPVYTEDPRLAPLLDSMRRLPCPKKLALVDQVLESAGQRQLRQPTVDFGLAALAFVAGMEPDAATAIFTIARLAGWTAHYLEEIEETPLRFRPRAVYAIPGLETPRTPPAGG